MEQGYIELLVECRAMIEELTNQVVKLSAEKEELILKNISLRDEREELITNNLNLMAATAELSSKVEELTQENEMFKLRERT